MEQTVKLVKIPNVSYNINISKDVEDKIQYICRKISDVEWSGILFFTYKGSFKNSLEINCVDIYLMDIGSHAYTEFEMSPDVIAYMTEKNLLNCQFGLIHSHHNMQTFFSSTDLNTLYEEGLSKNNFVSLIVNNKGEYVAAITRKPISKVIVQNVTYDLFDSGSHSEKNEYSESDPIVEYAMLNVHKENTQDFSDIDTRFKEIKEAKEKEKTKNFEYIKPVNSNYENKYYSTNNKQYNIKSLFDDEPLEKSEDLDLIVAQLITGSVLVSNSIKVDLEKWIKHMPSLYAQRFGSDDDGFESFKAWAETFVEYLMFYNKDVGITTKKFGNSDKISEYAYNIKQKLLALPKNKYIDHYVEALDNYIDFY